MKLEEVNILNIKNNGFCLIMIRLIRPMKNVKPEFKGITESFARAILGIYFLKDRITIHILFYMKIIKI